MHELSIAESLVTQLEDVLNREHAAGILRVELRVGVLSGVEPEALAMAFPVATENTRIHGAELAIEIVEADVKCRSCGSTTRPEFPFFICADCGSAEIDVISGRELLIGSVELKMPDNTQEGDT